MKNNTVVLFYSEGPNTSRYEVCRGTLEACKKYQAMWNNSRAVWDYVETEQNPDTPFQQDCLDSTLNLLA